MQQKTITVLIDENGNSSIDLDGFAGQGCEKVLRDFRAIRQALESLGMCLPSGAVGIDLNSVLHRCTRSLGHSGNYKYAWVFSRAAAHHMPPPLPYPKLDPLFHFHP